MASSNPKPRATKKRPAPRRPTPEQSSAIGQRLIAGMESLLSTMKAGGLVAVEKKFTVRKVKMAKFEVPTLGKDDVVAIRNSLGVSQPVFAGLIGVSPALVKGWEQGSKVPSGAALRFLAEVRRRGPHLARLVSRAVQPEGGRVPVFGGTYLSVVLDADPNEAKFAREFFKKVETSQGYVAWTDEAFAEDASYRRMTTLGHIALAALLAGVVALAAYVGYLRLK